MVYSGKPSRGCHNCRRRKIHCDQLPDGCSQCLRSQRECPGYPEPSNFKFRDETESVIKRSQTIASSMYTPSFTTATPSELQTLISASGRTTPVQDGGSSIIQSSPRSWSPSGDEQASAFFTSNFVLGAGAASEGHSEGHLERITQINYEAEDHLLASMKATGFAGLFGSFHDPVLLLDARKNYLKAVTLTNTALRSPDRVKRDSTLLAVLILGLFERVIGDDNESLMNYERHAIGAAAILKIRGHEQLETNEGRRLFIQVTSILLAICMLREIHIPAPVLELREHPILRAEAATHDSMHILDLTITCVEFNAGVKDGTISDPSYILAQALELDNEFNMIFDKVPVSWRYKTVFDENADPRAVFAGCYHEYASFWTARMWNISRLVRLSLHTNIRDTLLKINSPDLLDPINLRYSAQLQESRDTMRAIQADIVASVPIHTGLHLSLPWPSESDQATSEQHSISEDINRKKPIRVRTPTDESPPDANLVTRAEYIMYPLYRAGLVDVDETTKACQLWSLQMLQYVGHSIGIRQALMFASIIEKTIQ